jgi:hypothetical protein
MNLVATIIFKQPDQPSPQFDKDQRNVEKVS